MHEVLVNRLGGLSLPRKSVVRLTDHPDMTLDVYRGRKTTKQKKKKKKIKPSQEKMCPLHQLTGKEPDQTAHKALPSINHFKFLRKTKAIISMCGCAD